MAVQLETSLGEIVIDLHCNLCPLTCKNFLKLCKIKYYNNCIFHDVKKDFIAQTGDPTGTGSGGDSIYKFLYGDQARFFDDEIHPKLTHEKIGTVAMASAGENLNASQFYITLRTGLDYLDGKHTVFGEVAEGLETLMRINEAYVDEKGRPYKNIRIKHAHVLDDPFPDPPALADMIPDKSPDIKPPAEGEEVRLEDDWVPMDELMAPEEVDKSLRKKEAHSRAVVLEMIGDIPDADIAPPENVLFICKLNPVTQEEDLHTLFSRFGKIISADIIKDYKTGDSLCYGFIEFETKEACEAAYFKMDNVLIDDRRIHVDFSQSVAKLWTRFRKFGAKDTNEHGPDAQQPGRGKSGCFNCGEFGHLKKDCPHGPGGSKEAAASGKPKYTLKEPGGQRGDSRQRYEMVFDDAAAESEKPSGERSSRVHYDQRPPGKRPSRDDDEEKRTRQRLSPRERDDDRSYRSDRTGNRDERKVDWRSRGRDNDSERQTRLPPPPPPSSRGRSDNREDDRPRKRGDSKQDEREDGRREDKYGERGDARTEERTESRRDGRRDSRREVGEQGREDRGDFRRNDRGKQEEIETRMEDRSDSKRDDREEPRGEDRSDRGKPGKEERRDSRRDDREPRTEERNGAWKDDKEPRIVERSSPQRDNRGEPRRVERGDLRRDDRELRLEEMRDDGEPRRKETSDPRRDHRGEQRKDERGDQRRNGREPREQTKEEKGDLGREGRREPREQTKEEKGDPGREGRGELRREERRGDRREEKSDSRRDDRGPRREERSDSRRDDRGEQRREERTDRRDQRGEPRARDNFHRDERGEPRKEERTDHRKVEKGEGRGDLRRDGREEREVPRRDERREFQREERVERRRKE